MPPIQSNDYSQDYSLNEPASQNQPLVIPNTKPSVDILSSSAVSLSSNR
jgi:hypothetical protein